MLGLLLYLTLTMGVFLTGGRADPETDKDKKDNAAMQAASALYADIRTESLPNGLRIYLKPIPGAQIVSTMVAYRVGSADEDLDATGLSHYLEHLMFKGTDKVQPGDIDRLTLRNGGANNAYTSEDMTVYHFDFAADRWEGALEVEADRMRNLRIDEKHEFEQEKGAVIEELQRGEDEPWDLEQKAILPVLFGKKAPYGHPVIGEREHVRGATAKVIKAHYDKWYHPNNAALIVCGDFDPDKAMVKIQTLFGPIPKAELPKRKPEIENQRQGPQRIELDSKFESPRLMEGYNAVPSNHPDTYALDVLDSLLTSGKTCRLYKKFIEGEEIASSVGSANTGGRYPGWFTVQMELLRNKDVGNAEKLLLQELQKLRDEPVSEAELKRVKQTLLANTIFARESVHGLADSIARGVMVADLDFLKNYLPRILAVSAGDIQRVAKKYLDPEKRVAVWSVPKKRDDADKEAAVTGRAGVFTASRLERQKDGRAAAGKGMALQDAQRVVLPNGLVLLLLENHRLPILVAQAAVRHVSLLEPEAKAGLAALMGSLLDEGTAKHTSAQIAETIEDVGGKLDLNSGGGSVRVLAPNRLLGLKLLLECLSQPNFPKDAVAREKAQQLSVIDDMELRPEAKAEQVFHQLVFGKHPAGRPALGTRKTVEPLTRADCVAFHKELFVPNNTILAVVGDFNSKEVIDEITKLSADWKKADLPKPNPPEVTKPKEYTERILTMPDAAQLHVYIGHVGIRRNDPDYHKLLVMDYVLGTGPGFTDRLSSKLRDRAGLAYEVSGNITATAGEEPGLFNCYVGTDPKNFDKVRKMILAEIKLIRDTKPTKEEVEDAKKYLLGNLPFQLTTIGRVAGQLVSVERLGLGLDYLEKYRRAVAAVTPEEIQEVARKHLDPDHLILTAAGAVSAEGKLLEKAPAPNP
ncbi:MAG: M16 family metallopeptidase [Gemmataceae bacterium]